MEVLDHLEADEAAADDNRTCHAWLVDPRANAPRVGNRPHVHHAWQVEAWHVRLDGRGARGEHQTVVALVTLDAGGQVSHANRLCTAVDGEDVGLDLDVDVEPLAEEFARRNEQLLL